jgi:molecular chaperone GrpE
MVKTKKVEECVQESQMMVSVEQYEALQKEHQQLGEELEKAKNDYFRAYADADNLKKRLQAQHDQLIKYRAQSFALDILPVIDNLQRALTKVDENDPMIKGLMMVYQQLIDALKKEGVEEIEALNQPFDANLHHAIMSEQIEGIEPNIVVEVLQKGYVLKDRILRASLVKVSE